MSKIPLILCKGKDFLDGKLLSLTNGDMFISFDAGNRYVLLDTPMEVYLESQVYSTIVSGISGLTNSDNIYMILA